MTLVVAQKKAGQTQGRKAKKAEYTKGSDGMWPLAAYRHKFVAQKPPGTQPITRGCSNEYFVVTIHARRGVTMTEDGLRRCDPDVIVSVYTINEFDTQSSSIFRPNVT